MGAVKTAALTFRKGRGTMMYYPVTIIRSEAHFPRASAPLRHFAWENNGYEPRTEARLAYMPQKGFLLQMRSFETDLRSECRKEDGRVCDDSCMEFFVNFNPDFTDKYPNLEFNPSGTLHAKIGSGREGRQPLPKDVERPHVSCKVLPDRWIANVLIPISTVEALFGKSEFKDGDMFRGNFYKCGNKTKRPHYGMWNPVTTEKLDFHQPEYFGKLFICPHPAAMRKQNKSNPK